MIQFNRKKRGKSPPLDFTQYAVLPHNIETSLHLMHKLLNAITGESSTSFEPGGERGRLFARHLSRVFTSHVCRWSWLGPWRHRRRDQSAASSGVAERHRVGISRAEYRALYLVSALLSPAYTRGGGYLYPQIAMHCTSKGQDSKCNKFS